MKGKKIIIFFTVIFCFSFALSFLMLKVDKKSVYKNSQLSISGMTEIMVVQPVDMSLLNSSVFSSYTEIEKSLLESLNQQLGFLDFSQIEDVINSLDAQGKAVFEGNLKSKIESIINGDFTTLGDNAFSAFINLLLESFVKLIPLMASIIAVGILSSMLNQVRSNQSGKSMGDVIHFICYGMIIVLIVASVYKLLAQTTQTLNLIKTEIDAVFPILLTLLTAVGGNVSVGVYQPAVALFSGSILQIFNSVLVPIFIFSFVFSIISNLSNTVKLDKFTSFFSSLFKWIVGTVFTVFIAFISIQGITSSFADGISVKTAKFAMKSYIPILGGYLADGFNVIMASSLLIKNAVGVCGLILLVSIVLSPILNIVIFNLFLKLTASILEPLTDSRVSNFLFGVTKSLSMLAIILIGVSFMFLILSSLIMFSANFI